MHPRYRHAARIYDTAFPFFSLGAGPRIHRKVAQAVPRQPGATVLDAGCGTGLVIPLLRNRVGPEGKVIGIDMTEPMLDRARQRVTRMGWDNVELHCADMTDFDPGTPLDAAVFTLSLSAAEPTEVFRHVLSRLRPGATVVIADGIPASGRWYHPLANAYARLRAPLVGSHIGRAAKIAELVRTHLVDVRTELMWGGLFTIASGRTPSVNGEAEVT